MFARFKNKLWCIDLTYVDKLAENKNKVKFSLNRQDLFDGTVDAMGMKTNDCEGTVRASLTMITERNPLMRIRVHNGTDFAGSFKRLCEAEGKKFTLLWTKPWMRLLKVPNGPWKLFFSVTWNITDPSFLTKYLNSSHPWIPKRFAQKTWY